MNIPSAKAIRDFQAPSTEKLLNRCETQWRIILMEGIKGLSQTQSFVQVPVMGETEDMIREAIVVLQEKDLGFEYSFELLPSQAEDRWTTGYLFFRW